jgi:flagellar export protein FliJ
MKRFRFALQSVATLRELRELRARESLAAAIRVCEQAELALADARGRRELIEDLVRSGRAFTQRAAEHVAFLRALRLAAADEMTARRNVEQAHSVRDQRLAEYYEASRAVKVMDNLETRARAAHRLATEHEEQTVLDERSSVAAARAHRFLS